MSSRSSFRNIIAGTLISAAALFPFPASADSSLNRAWNAKHRALVLDAYEYNEIDLAKIAKNKRVAGIIHKGSDGLPPAWGCKSAKNNIDLALCKENWQTYSVTKELYKARRGLAKALGLKWGAYHLGRPGNAIDQANHFIDFTDPQPDELIAIDIEDIDPQFLSLKEAEDFARHIKRRLGRYPVLYVNGSTAKHIAQRREQYPLLSRLTLWYARYTPTIGEHFPKGNWESYALWQFASQVNCSKSNCPYRVAGTNDDIDINVADMSVQELKKAWPLGDLVDVKDPKTSPEMSDFLVATAISQLPAASQLRKKVAELTAKIIDFIQRPNEIALSRQGVDDFSTASITANISSRR